MIATTENVVTGVEARIVKEGTPEQRTIYDVVDRDGTKWTAWERELAEYAYSLKGQPSIWKVEVKEAGKYTNRTLKEISPKTGASTLVHEAVATTAATFGAASATLPSPGVDPIVKNTFEQATTGPTDKDRMIWRQTATKVAATLNPKTETEFWGTTLALISFYETGVLPRNDHTVAQSAQTATDYENPFAPPEPDDDIPF